LDEVAVAGIRFGGAILLSPSQEVIKDCGDTPPLDGLAFLLRLRHNLVKLAKGLITVWPEGDLLPAVVYAPDFAGLPIPGFCTTSHDDVSRF
jgi:hypothetical protein